MKQLIQTLEQWYFLVKLLGYHFDIEYNPGKSNKVANALSWQDKVNDALEFNLYVSILFVVSRVLSKLIETIRDETSQFDKLKSLASKIDNDPHAYVEFQKKNGLIFFNGWIILS